MASIDNLKSTISKRGGLATSNRFQVIFSAPTQSLINQDETTLVGALKSGNIGAVISDPRDISLLCESVNLPGRQITSIDYTSNKQSVKVPYSVLNEDVSMSFILTNDYYIKTLMDNWLSSIVDMDIYRVGYKKDFSTDVIIQQLDKNDIPIYGVTLQNAYPTTLGSVSLDNNTENSIQKLNVTFAYDNYIPQGPISSSISAIETTINNFELI